MIIQLIVPKLAYYCVKAATKAVKAVEPNAAIQSEPQAKLVSVETQE